MKKLLAFTAFWVFCLGFSQNTDYADRMEHIFGNIDKTKVTTGYLKEFGIRFNEMEAYSGVLDTINWTDKTQWHSLYSSLYTMRVGTVAASMTAPGTVANYLKTQQAGTSDILFAVQHYNYQQYKANAYTNGDVTVVNERIYDVTGKNPYETKRVFAVAPLKHYLEGNTFSFRLPSAMIYGNTGLTPSQIQVDFGNGQGYQTIVPDTAVSVSYLSGGEKEIKVKFVYSSGGSKGVVYYSHSKIYIDYIAPDFQARFNDSGISTHIITGDPWQGASATGIVTIETAGTDGILDKPLIVVEGFDPDNSFGYRNFIDGVSFGGINIDIDPTPTFYSLNQAIEDEGYDLVFINFANGTDYIQRNAYMVEKVIEWVNNNKTGNEKNVVMGMSMGGLVARYALRNMELNSKTHDTKLYISHDAPHQGANVPVAFQAMVRHLVGEGITLPVFLSIFDIHIIDLADMLPELEDGLALLQTPAAQQMLIYQLQGTGGYTTVNNNTLYHSFASEYTAMGYPQQGGIRNIAIANGSECGTTLDYNPYADLVNINYKTDFYRLSVLINYLSLNPIKFLASVFSTNTDLKAEFNLKALPNKQAKQIYRGRVYVKKTVLGFINSEDTIISLKTLNSTTSMLPLDNSGGGIYNIDTFVHLPPSMNEYILQRNFNFIPTYSSLDIGGGNQTISYSDLTKAYSPLSPPLAPNNTPFDNFFTNPEASENHIQFTLNNGNWLLEELQGNTAFYSCASACTSGLPLMIYGGTEQLCDNATASYTLSGLNPDSGATVTWSVIPGGAISNIASIGNYVTITSSGNLNGIGLLQASISTNCGNRNVTRQIYFGAQRPRHLNEYGEEIFHIEMCTMHHYYATFEMPPGTLEWEWRKILGNYTFSASGNQAIIHSTQPTSGVFDVRIKDACGWSPRTMITVNISNCSGGGYMYTAYPNPATDVLYIAETPQSESEINSFFNTTEPQSSSATLYDFNGNQVAFISPASGNINVESLSSGQYILVIQYGSQTETHHIIIQ